MQAAFQPMYRIEQLFLKVNRQFEKSGQMFRFEGKRGTRTVLSTEENASAVHQLPMRYGLLQQRIFGRD